MSAQLTIRSIILFNVSTGTSTDCYVDLRKKGRKTREKDGTKMKDGNSSQICQQNICIFYKNSKCFFQLHFGGNFVPYIVNLKLSKPAKITEMKADPPSMLTRALTQKTPIMM